MADYDDRLLDRLDQELEDERNARAELAWYLEPRSAEPMIEAADQRRLPPGHIAYLGAKALGPFQSEY